MGRTSISKTVTSEHLRQPMDPLNHILPSHPSLLSLDPLGICDEDEPSTWSVILTAICSFRQFGTIHTIGNLIQDLSYSIHMDGHLDTTFLNQYILQKYPDPHSPVASQILNNVLDAAIELASLFPTQKIPYLNQHHPLLKLSIPQIRSLLAHQLLNTLIPPKGNDWGCTFSCWYSGQQPLPNAVSGYLSTLLNYFTHPIDYTEHISYRYYQGPPVQDNLSFWTTGQNYSLLDCLVIEPTFTRSVQFPHEKVACTLISSNSSPGFGASCTQEELVTAACPPLLPVGAFLVAPPIPPDAAIVVHGNMPLYHWRGQGRQAHSLGTYTITEHTFVFLDASELDTLTSNNNDIPDLDPKYLFRDLQKAFTGLSAVAGLGIQDVASPLWGAGAFGGDPIIKTIIMCAAAARARVSMHISVDVERSYRRREDAPSLIYILERLKEDWISLTVEEAIQRLYKGELWT